MPDLKLNEIIGSAIDGTENTESTAPVDTDTTETSEDTQSESSNTEDLSDDDDLGFNWDEVKNDPKALKAAKNFQAAYTKARTADKAKLKELEAKAAKVSAFNPQVLSLAEEVNELVRIDPTGNLARQRLAQAAQIQQAQQAQQNVQQTPQINQEMLDDPYLGPVIAPILQKQAVIEQAFQQQQLATLETQITQEFDEFQKKHGIELPLEKRQAILKYGLANNYPTVTAVMKDLYFDELAEARANKRAEEVSKVQARKAAQAPAPSTTPNRKVDTSELPTQNIKDLVGAIYDKIVK